MTHLPAKFREKSFANFNGSEEEENILKKYSEGFIHNSGNGGWLNHNEPSLVQNPGSFLLTGKTGCGKTHLAVAVIRELVMRSFHIGSCLFTTAPELLLEIRATFNSETGQTEDVVLDKYSKCDLLILDDLGAEKATDFAIQSLYLVIDRRNRELRPTIVTTNLSLEEVEEKIDARMASRLADMKIIKLNMPDYRKKRG